MRVSVIGGGYVGTTAAACLADLGHTVTIIDISPDVVADLNAGTTGIHEPGLPELVETHAGDRLTATTEYTAVQETDITLITVGTPIGQDGVFDASALLDASTATANALRETQREHVIAIKSTVLPHVVSEEVVPTVETTLGSRARDRVDIAVNPEFLREGNAVTDFRHPDKYVFGTPGSDSTAMTRLHELYEPIIASEDPAVIETDRKTAAIIKYANNTFLAAKISLINDIGNICKEHNIDSYTVAKAIGTDSRISEEFLRSGIGWGGSCFQKDTTALITASEDHGYEPEMLTAAVTQNEQQVQRAINLVEKHVEVDGERVTVLGLAFKSGTNDTRGSRAKPIIETLQDRGAEVAAYDPVANEAMHSEYPSVEYCTDPETALTGATAAIVVTGWDEFRDLDDEFDAMQTPVVVDGRRVITHRDGILYEGLTWP